MLGQKKQNQSSLPGKKESLSPLNGIKVIEMAGLAPSPFCGMILADFGANVLVVERTTEVTPEIPNVMRQNPFDRGKRFLKINLKQEKGVEIVRDLLKSADVLLEPYRPGVMEKLGLGPSQSMAANPRLIYARLTGWGQHGPYANMAGHDINYIALSGALSLFRRSGESPVPPVNVLGDFAAGGLTCALGILLALFAREQTGQGQVIDAAMLDGASYLCTQFYGLLANELMSLNIGTNLLDGGAPFYHTYKTADNGYMAVGALEGRFYLKLLEGLGLNSDEMPDQNDTSSWPWLKEKFAEIFASKTREEWSRIFAGKDACVVPVLNLNETESHAHHQARRLLTRLNGLLQPSPAPKLSATPARPGTIPEKGASAPKILQELGYRQDYIQELLKNKTIE